MVRVKVCGITNLEDALTAVKLGADALGFVFAPSPRQVTQQQVVPIVAQLPPFVCKVGVFVDSEFGEVREVMKACSLDLVQLHGSESPGFCQKFSPQVIKSFRVENESILALLPQYKVSAYLLDSFHAILKGGTGKSFDWGIAEKAAEYGTIVLSGGLNPENVGQAVKQVKPYAVDVSSGVEREPGKKDHDKLRAFLEAAKREGERT